MESLKHRIMKGCTVISDRLVNLDHVLNHQVDPGLMMDIGKKFASMFHNEPITKVLTIEASGIAVAIATAAELGVPMLFARRKTSSLMEDDLWVERVPSFTKGIVTDIVICKRYIAPTDHILIIDDIIANGDALKGLIQIVKQSGAQLCGIGVVVEKCFQNGGRALRNEGIRLESIVRIQSLENNELIYE